jgi:hypothetical protein
MRKIFHPLISRIGGAISSVGGFWRRGFIQADLRFFNHRRSEARPSPLGFRQGSLATAGLAAITHLFPHAFPFLRQARGRAQTAQSFLGGEFFNAAHGVRFELDSAATV